MLVLEGIECISPIFFTKRMQSAINAYQYSYYVYVLYIYILYILCLSSALCNDIIRGKIDRQFYKI